MALHRFFVDGPLPAPTDAPVELPLSAADRRHLTSVLRAAPDDLIVLVVDGQAHTVRLAEVGERVTGTLLEALPAPVLPPVALVQGLPKSSKMDDIVRQTTELGVARIIPLAAERSVTKLEAGKADARVERWRRIAAEAAKQSQRAQAPEITPVLSLGELLGMLKASTVLVCWESATGAPGIGAALQSLAPDSSADVAVVVGPEGGLTAAEVTALEQAGGVLVTLGETILRTETAGVVATALALYARGALGAGDER